MRCNLRLFKQNCRCYWSIVQGYLRQWNRMEEWIFTKLRTIVSCVTNSPRYINFLVAMRFVHFRQREADRNSLSTIARKKSTVEYFSPRNGVAKMEERTAQSCHRVLFLTFRVAFISFLTNFSTLCSNAHGQIHVSSLYVYSELQ